MQLSQVPVDGNKYDVVATITNLTAGKSVGQKGYMMQKFDLADASKAVKGVAFFYAGNQPDMAFPPNWNGQTMTVSVSAKQNGEYTNFTASIPQGGAQFAGGNQANAAPIANAMAAKNVNYANQSPANQGQGFHQPSQQAPASQEQGYSRERNINLQSARKDAIAFLRISNTENVTEELVKALSERFADWAMGLEMMPPTF